MPIIYKPDNKNLVNKLDSTKKKQLVLIKKNNSNDETKSKALSGSKTGSDSKNKLLDAGKTKDSDKDKLSSVNQNKENKIIIINKTEDSQFLANILKISAGTGLGIFGKVAYDKIYGEDKSGIIVNNDLVSYFRKKFDTKPEDWRFSPRYYFINFLDMLFKYENNNKDNKITDEYITLMVKYGLLAFMPTSKNPIDEQIFGSLVSTILEELNYYVDFGGVVKWSIKKAGKDNAELARKWGTAGVKDTDFLQAKQDSSMFPPILAKNYKRLNWVVNNLGLTKEKFGKYFDSISKNLVRYMNTVVDKCRDKTPENKLVLDVNDDPELSQADKDDIAKLLEDQNIDENIKRLIKLNGYQLALIFSNLLIRIAISQSFEIGMADTPK